MGRMVYTCAMLLIFSAIIVLLMFRSIKRSSSAIEMEALLDAMRFREELDIQQRQRRRLLKAKTKVAAWLTKAGKGDKGWRSAPQLLPPRRPTVSSSNSDIPEIVVTEEVPMDIFRSKTPCLSLLYDFENSPDLDVNAAWLGLLLHRLALLAQRRFMPYLAAPFRPRHPATIIDKKRSVNRRFTASIVESGS
ncbi:unnamed protein product, partial [Mesorhabditis spiculigera]